MKRKQRLIALDLETNSIMTVSILDIDNKDPKHQCILRHRSFWPRYGSPLMPGEIGKSASFGHCYQLLDKVQFFLTNSK